MGNKIINEYNRENSPLHTKSYFFAIRIVKMRKHIIKTHKEFNITNQILRSGTAIGALVREAEFAQSPQDFINKLSIALKEGNETYYWLNILHDTDYLSEEAFNSMLSDCNELIALLIASIKTTKQRNIK
ncbi:MAG: four helix bundle protein [Prevotella sp.]|nr:four helix bundle protein [Prevotella sp.]